MEEFREEEEKKELDKVKDVVRNRIVSENLKAGDGKHWVSWEILLGFVFRVRGNWNLRVLDLVDLAGDRWEWNRSLFGVLEKKWANWSFGNLMNMIRFEQFIKDFLGFTIEKSVNLQEVESWTSFLSGIIESCIPNTFEIICKLASVYISTIRHYSFPLITQLIQPFIDLIQLIQSEALANSIYLSIFLKLKLLNFPEFNNWVLLISKSQ